MSHDNYFDLTKKRKPSQAEIQDQRRRMNQRPAISDAQLTGEDGVGRGKAAQQRADEAHNRTTNAALDAAHSAAESANTNANGRLANVSDAVKYAHLTNGIVFGEKMTPNFVGVEATVGANSFIDYNHNFGVDPRIPIPEVRTDFGWATLAYAGQLYYDHVNGVAIRIVNNTASSAKVRVRFWR